MSKSSKCAGLYVIATALLVTGCAEMDIPPLFDEEKPAPPPVVSQPSPPPKPVGVVKTPAQQTNQQPEVIQASPQPNLIPQAVQRAGVNKCIPRIKQFTDFLTEKSQHGAQVFVGPGTPDFSITSLAMEVQGEDQLSYVDASFAPGQSGNSCGGLYEKVTYYPMSCDAVARSQYPKMKRANNLRQSIVTLDGGDRLKVFLMPAAQNCVAIKKEVVYR